MVRQREAFERIERKVSKRKSKSALENRRDAAPGDFSVEEFA